MWNNSFQYNYLLLLNKDKYINTPFKTRISIQLLVTIKPVLIIQEETIMNISIQLLVTIKQIIANIKINKNIYFNTTTCYY